MPFDLTFEYNPVRGIIAIIGLLTAGFISGIFYWASKEAEESRPAFLKNHKLYYLLKISEYSLMAVSLIYLFKSLHWITTLVAYLLMEYRWHQIMKPVYRKHFGIPTEKTSPPAVA